MIGGIERNSHQDIEGHAVRGGSSVAFFHLLQQSITTYKEIFKDAANSARTTMTQHQRVTNQEFAPVITEHMLDAYSGCVAKYGTGSYVRMKALMQNHVVSHRHDMFTESIQKVETLLGKLVEDVEKLLLAKADEVFHSVKRDYTRVVIGGDTNSEQLPREQRQRRRGVLEILEGSEHQYKFVLDLESEAECEDEEAAEKEKATDADVDREMSPAGLDKQSTGKAPTAKESSALPSGPQQMTSTRDGTTEVEQPMVGVGDGVENEIEDRNRPEGLAVDAEHESQGNDFSESQSAMESSSEANYTSDEI